MFKQVNIELYPINFGVYVHYVRISNQIRVKGKDAVESVTDAIVRFASGKTY